MEKRPVHLRLALRVMLVGLVLALSMPAYGFDVTRIGNWTKSGLDSYTVPAGTNRLLVFVTGFENDGDITINSVTYGGKAMTKALGQATGTSPWLARCEIWYLPEADIPAGANGFVVNYVEEFPSADPMGAAATFENVDQTDPLVDTEPNWSTNHNTITVGVNVAQGGMAVAGVFCGNNGSFTWANGWTEGSDQTSDSTCTMSTGDHANAADGTDTASATHTGANRLVMVAATLRPSSGAASDPTLTVTTPTAGSSWATDTGTVALSGMATDDTGIVDVTWINSAGGFGVCLGTDLWSATIPLAPGTNTITITVRDQDGNLTSSDITVTYTPSSGSGSGTGGTATGGDTDIFQTILQPNVLVLFDTSGSMRCATEVDGYDPSVDHTTPLLKKDREVVFARNHDCYGDHNYVSSSTSDKGKVTLEYVNYDSPNDLCSSNEGMVQKSDTKGYFYFDRDDGEFLSKEDYEGDDDEIKVFLPYATFSVDGSSTKYDYDYLNWIFYYSTKAQRDALKAMHDDPERRALLTRYQAAQTVLRDLINDNPAVRFGIMKLQSDGGGEMVADIPSTLETINDAIDNELWPSGGTPLAEALEDCWDYYRDQISGHPFTQDYWCRRNFVIVMTDGVPTYDANDLSSYIKKDWDGDHGGTEANGWNGNEEDLYPNNGSDYLDDVAYYMQRNDAWPGLEDTQNVTTYTIGFHVKHGLLEDTADNGGGRYFTADSTKELNMAFRTIVQEILDISTSYTAPVVPVSHMQSTSSADKIYIALFKPTLSAFWKGNIKKFGIATTDNAGLGIETGDILDKTGALATSTTGVILDAATSYWSSASDGGETEAGGVGEVLLNRNLSANPRKIYTYVKEGKPLTHNQNAFTKGNSKVTRVMLQVENEGEKDKLIDFVHGYDAYDDDGDGDTTDKRDWILGAFLHSRPEIVHYSSSRSVIFAGANDGMLHAFDDTTGQELWAFIPPALLPSLKDLTGTSLVYYVDGSPKVYSNDANKDGEINKADGDQAILVCGLRRGGWYYFALDVTDPDAPEIPSGWMDWGNWVTDKDWQSTGLIGPDMTKNSSKHATSTYPYAEMGQSWSAPMIGKINDQGSAKDVFIIGGGYDSPNQDSASPGSDTMGRAIFVVDILTGDMVWKYSYDEDVNMSWSIPSDVTAIDTTDNGFIDRLYVGDMGGRLWRFNLKSLDPADWTATPKILFNASADGTIRKIFYPVDVSLEEGYEMVFFGTGDRARPKEANVVDRIYAVKDRNPGSPLDETFLFDVTDDILQDPGYGGDKVAVRNQILSGNGWYIRLEDNLGEKILAAPLVFFGTAYYTTFTPIGIGDPCEFDEGVARLYALNYRTGEAVLNYDTTSDAIGRSDRCMVIGTAIPSGLVMALIKGRPQAYIGIRGGILNPDIPSTSLVSRIFWRHQF
jgi:type IV pilus assembly protein PilY1